ncbi:hypothetical protein Pmani_038898, partial [Petrolisthes manimaculis]
TLQSPDYINGFLIQVRKVEGGTVAPVGMFLDPHRAEYLACNKSRDTVINERAPLRLANLTFTWLAPETNLGGFSLCKASVLVNKGTQYKVFRSDILALNLYPVSTKECAVSKSCFRYCMKHGGPSCPAHTSRYMASLQHSPSAVSITLGGQLPDANGYLAVGFTRDHRRLSNTDISVCYRTDEDQVEVEHYLLESIDYPPDLHMGELSLVSSDVDDDYTWCTFNRPTTGKHNNLLTLNEPHYYFYFWGARNGSTIFLPHPRSMKRSRQLITSKDKPFNQIVYNSGPRVGVRTPFTVVAAVVVVVVVHVLLC